MSLSLLLENITKPWLSARTYSITNDTSLTTYDITSNTGTIYGLTTNNINFARTDVTQSTSSSTDVTVNSQSGIITTFASGSPARPLGISFKVINNSVLVDDAIYISLISMTGSGLAILPNVVPVLIVTDIIAGEFTIHVLNAGTQNMSSNVFKIAFWIVHKAIE